MLTPRKLSAAAAASSQLDGSVSPREVGSVTVPNAGEAVAAS
jgi:hypothetical protein